MMPPPMRNLPGADFQDTFVRPHGQRLETITERMSAVTVVQGKSPTTAEQSLLRLLCGPATHPVTTTALRRPCLRRSHQISTRVSAADHSFIARRRRQLKRKRLAPATTPSSHKAGADSPMASLFHESEVDSSSSNGIHPKPCTLSPKAEDSSLSPKPPRAPDSPLEPCRPLSRLYTSHDMDIGSGSSFNPNPLLYTEAETLSSTLGPHSCNRCCPRSQMLQPIPDTQMLRPAPLRIPSRAMSPADRTKSQAGIANAAGLHLVSHSPETRSWSTSRDMGAALELRPHLLGLNCRKCSSHASLHSSASFDSWHDARLGSALEVSCSLNALVGSEDLRHLDLVGSAVASPLAPVPTYRLFPAIASSEMHHPIIDVQQGFELNAHCGDPSSAGQCGQSRVDPGQVAVADAASHLCSHGKQVSEIAATARTIHAPWQTSDGTGIIFNEPCHSPGCNSDSPKLRSGIAKC